MDKPVQGPTAAAEDYLQVALDNMPGALVHTDEDLNIVFCNDRFQGDVSGPGRTAAAGTALPGLPALPRNARLLRQGRSGRAACPPRRQPAQSYRRILAGLLQNGWSSASRARRHRRPVISRTSVLAGVAAITLFASQAALGQSRVDIVNFQSLTYPGSLFTPPFMAAPGEGTQATIFGLLRLPQATGRVPAVVITHGCSGITGAETYWAENLVPLGMATFVVNSLVGRNLSRVCSGPSTISSASVLTDIYRARDLLADNPRIDPARIAVLGFSFGGRNALWASYPRFQQRYDSGSSRFAAYMAFYPANCHIRLADDDRVGDAPIRIFHGAADDAVVIGRCRDYVARLRNAGKDVALLEYAGAKHWFDNGDLANRQTMTGFVNYSGCTFLEQDGRIIDAATGGPAGTGSPCVVSEGSMGYNAAAREQATADVQNFLRSLFKL